MTTILIDKYANTGEAKKQSVWPPQQKKYRITLLNCTQVETVIGKEFKAEHAKALTPGKYATAPQFKMLDLKQVTEQITLVAHIDKDGSDLAGSDTAPEVLRDLMAISRDGGFALFKWPGVYDTTYENDGVDGIWVNFRRISVKEVPEGQISTPDQYLVTMELIRGRKP